jgi:hypothetical protein
MMPRTTSTWAHFALIGSLSLPGNAATGAPRADQVTADNASELLVGGPDAVGGLGDWGLSNGTLCAVVADPSHEGYVLPTGGSLVDLGYCGRNDDQFVILEGLANLSRSESPRWKSVTSKTTPQRASITVTGERGGVVITTTYALDTVTAETLHVETRLERTGPGPRLFAFGDASIHYSGALRPFVLARGETSQGFDHKDTGDATILDLVGSIIPLETVVLIGSHAAEAPISYGLRITEARFERPGEPARDVAHFGLATDTITFLGVLARPVWIGENTHAGLLELAQTPFMDLEVGDAVVFQRAIDVAPRNDAVAFTDALRPTSARVRGQVAAPSAGVEIVDLVGSAVGFATTDSRGHFALRIPAGQYEARIRASAGRSRVVGFEVREEEVDLGYLSLPAVSRIDVPATLAPSRLVFQGLGETADPLFDDDDTGLRVGGRAQPSHTASANVHLSGAAGDPDHVLLPPGRYRVLATRGPEFGVTQTSIEVAAGETLTLDLAPPLRVLETPGWIAADLHVHAAPSDDSTVPMRRRLASFVAEGGEVIVSTDHDHVSDYAPLIDSLGLNKRVQSIVGLEVTSTVSTPAAPFTAGHSNVFPLPIAPLAHRKGAIPSEGRRLRELIAAARAIPGERLVQLNHPREPGQTAIEDEGAFFTHLSVGSEFDPTTPLDSPRNQSLIERDPQSGLRDVDFDAIEMLNGPSMSRYRNVRADWFALLRQGERPTATGNSDTHSLRAAPAVPRNYVRMTDDAPAAFDEREFIENLKAGKSYVTTGPLLDVALESTPGRPGNVRLLATVRAAPWIDVSRLRIFVNGELEEDLPLPPSGRVERPMTFARDSFVTVEVEGEPGDIYRAILPRFTPFAHTNPIFVDADADGRWTPPGIKTP